MSRVVVIGAGMGGLAVAARLARLKHDVLVVERAATVGGMLGTITSDGFTWDTGPSSVTIPQAFRDLFRKTGKPIETVLDLVPVDPIAHYRFADGVELDLPSTGSLDVARALDGALGSGAGDDWTALMQRASAMWEVTRRDFVEGPLDGMPTLLRIAARRPRDLATIAPLRTLRGIGMRYLRDPRLRMLLDSYATSRGSDPRRAPAALACIPYVEQAFGAWQVRGGLRVLADATRARAERCGARFMLGASVARIHLEGGVVRAVELGSGERIACDVVVSDVDASVLYSSLLARPEQQRRLRKATPSYSAFSLLLGLSERPAGLRQHTVLFASDCDAELEALRAGRVAARPTIHVSAPEDECSIVVRVNAPRQGQVDWDAPCLADEYGTQLLDLMATRGLDVRAQVRARKTRTPADIERETGSPGGASYGTSSDGPRAAFLRPANRSPVPGLFLVGGSAHPGGGLPLVILSAAITADLIGPA